MRPCNLNHGCLLIVACLFAFATNPMAWAWDGNWTHAKSGNERDVMDDTGRSDKKAGTDPPQKYWIPSVRDFADVDPEEIHDYFDRKNRHYTPYALARIEQNIRYNSLSIPKGYYLIKPGDEQDGSPKVNLKNLTGQNLPLSSTMDRATQSLALSNEQRLPPLETEVEEPIEAPVQQLSPIQTPASSPPPVLDTKAPIYQTLVIIQQGKVMGVVPVHRMSQYRRTDKHEKKPRTAMAWVEWEERRPVLKFYYKKWVYETEFQ